MIDSNRMLVGLVALFVGVYLLPLTMRQLAVPDEMRYGEISREMLASGDTFSGQNMSPVLFTL